MTRVSPSGSDYGIVRVRGGKVKGEAALAPNACTGTTNDAAGIDIFQFCLFVNLPGFWLIAVDTGGDAGDSVFILQRPFFGFPIGASDSRREKGAVEKER
jgi:hypothetical protein